MTNDRERRAADRERNAFETLVLVRPRGTKEGAYECEAMDLSLHGMRLRTAYLPALGQELRCRFDVSGAQVDATGTVVWRQERAKGGEFGVSFTALSGPGAKAVRELIAEDDGDSAALTVPRPASAKGSRVRLHIEGLGAPLRARVRDAETGKILVGSQLEFLRVGKRLALEDVAQATSRPAFVEHVGVDVDPTSQVPQLVVRLRYAKKDEALTATPVPASLDASPAPVTIARTVSSPDLPHEPTSAARSARPEPPSADDATTEATPAALDVAWSEKMRDVAGAIGSITNNVTASLAKARTSMADFWAHWRAGTSTDAEPLLRRTTTVPPLDDAAPNPLRRSQEASNDEDGNAATDVRPHRLRRYAIVGGVGLTLLVGTLVAFRDKGEPPAGSSSEAGNTELPAGHAPPGLGAAPPPATMALPSGDTVNANVPLFGTLPLSTTEPVAPPAPAGSVALTNAPGENGVPSGGSMVDKEGSDDAPEKSSAPASHSTYGHGKVRNPHTVRLKMDSPVQDIKGSVTEASLTVTVPGRHNIEPATPLSKRDKRIVAVKATPNGHGTDVTIVFRDHVPPFLAKANGKMLEIDLGDTSQPADAEDAHGSAKRQAKKGADAEHSSHGHGTHGSKSERAHGKEGKHSAKGKHDEGRGKR